MYGKCHASSAPDDAFPKDPYKKNESAFSWRTDKCNHRSHKHTRGVDQHVLPLQRCLIGEVFGNFDSKTEEQYANKHKDPCPSRSRDLPRRIGDKSEEQNMYRRMKSALGMKSALVTIGK
jgi:hypothetical protein